MRNNDELEHLRAMLAPAHQDPPRRGFGAVVRRLMASFVKRRKKAIGVKVEPPKPRINAA